MITKTLKTVLLLGLTFALFSFDLPKGWFKAGSDPDKYEMGIDKGSGQDGKNTATIQSKEKYIKGFGTLMQQCLPEKYAGKRVKMTGYIKTKDVDQRAGFWFRVDGKNPKEPLAFDNMNDRRITGTTEWKKYEIVLDVAADATNLAYGALIIGTGKVWFDNITFEVVDASSPSTDMYGVKKEVPAVPLNLNFED
ncbi:MAG: hypothetical protein JNJ41_19690 [Bacteroidia bacterium]|nr:hypothetical protein [Bacteroidia bacterium]